MTFFELRVACAGALAIVVLVGYAWRGWSRHRQTRTRPASPEAIDPDHLEALRKIVAADYARQTKDHR